MDIFDLNKGEILIYSDNEGRFSDFQRIGRKLWFYRNCDKQALVTCFFC